ncbi:MAG: hypothetical protein KC503_05435, partial [Myxococcales bacterium]|nr:hypothetical protein [Myxococcales bacterium]
LLVLRDHDDFCVVSGSIRVPLLQDGERPFKDAGGAIALDAAGKPITQRSESIRFAVTVPKKPMPRDGYPLLFYSAGQGGAYTQVVDRGTFAEQDQNKLGTGPARYLAASGVAAISIEAPLVGPRHPSADVTGLDFFNVTNPVALRDNVRQAALDFTTLITAARALRIPPALCSEASTSDGGQFKFDAEQFYFHGHSTGATVGALVLGLEPDLRAGVLSGFGGSWLYNLTIKEQPLDFNNLVRLLLGYKSGDKPDLFDPALNLAQTLWEPAEPINWAARWAIDPRAGGRPRHLLIIEGVIDGYFPPPAVNAAALAARAEPLLPTVESTMLDDVALVGGRGLSAPAGNNLQTETRKVSSVVAQHEAPAGIDGHYVPFEVVAAKHQYRCFVQSGGERVPAGDANDALAACP